MNEIKDGIEALVAALKRLDGWITTLLIWSCVQSVAIIVLFSRMR